MWYVLFVALHCRVFLFPLWGGEGCSCFNTQDNYPVLWVHSGLQAPSLYFLRIGLFERHLPTSSYSLCALYFASTSSGKGDPYFGGVSSVLLLISYPRFVHLIPRPLNPESSLFTCDIMEFPCFSKGGFGEHYPELSTFCLLSLNRSSYTGPRESSKRPAL